MKEILFERENQGVNSFLVYKINNYEKIDSMTLGMILNNKIE